MTTQSFELQSVTNEELMAAAGGGPHFTSKKSLNAQRPSQAAEARDHGLQSLLASTTVATMG